MSKNNVLKSVLKLLAVPGGFAEKCLLQAEEFRDSKKEAERRAKVEAYFKKAQEEAAERDPLQRVKMILEDRWEKLGYDALLPEERDHLYLWWLNAEVNNGSFDQYLFNSTGDNATDALAALSRIGSTETHRILSEVIVLVGSPYPTDRTARWGRIEAIKSNDEALWERRMTELSEEYYNCTEPLEEPTLRLVLAAYRREGIPTPTLPF